MGERRLASARAYNFRKGFAPQDDRLPECFYQSHTEGVDGANKIPWHRPSDGCPRTPVALSTPALRCPDRSPTRAKPEDLDISWVAEAIGMPLSLDENAAIATGCRLDRA